MGCSPVLSPLSVLGAPLPAAGPVLLKQWEVAGVFPGSHILTRVGLTRSLCCWVEVLPPGASCFPAARPAVLPVPWFSLVLSRAPALGLLQSHLKCNYWASASGAEIFSKRLAFHSPAKSMCIAVGVCVLREGYCAQKFPPAQVLVAKCLLQEGAQPAGDGRGMCTRPQAGGGALKGARPCTFPPSLSEAWSSPL